MTAPVFAAKFSNVSMNMPMQVPVFVPIFASIIPCFDRFYVCLPQSVFFKPCFKPCFKHPGPVPGCLWQGQNHKVNFRNQMCMPRQLLRNQAAAMAAAAVFRVFFKAEDTFRFALQRGVAGRHVSATLDARAQKRIRPWGVQSES